MSKSFGGMIKRLLSYLLPSEFIIISVNDITRFKSTIHLPANMVNEDDNSEATDHAIDIIFKRAKEYYRTNCHLSIDHHTNVDGNLSVAITPEVCLINCHRVGRKNA